MRLSEYYDLILARTGLFDWKYEMCEINIDECTVSPPFCHVNAQCSNNIGSYNCTCNTGYIGNGKTCSGACRYSAFAKNSYCFLSSISNVPRVQAQTTCPTNLLVQNVNNQSGLIQSSFTTTYSSNMDCEWTLSADTKLELVFVGRFITESNADFVYVYNGNSSSARLIGRFSGSSRPGPSVSSTTQLHVRFTSNGSSQQYGFKATYRVLNQASVRLRGGGLHYGRVEIFYNDQWGTVCDDDWDINDAHVVCRQLGFSRLASNAYTGAHYGQGTGPIWMDDVACSGSESHIYDCRQRGWGSHDCTHSKDSSVRCRYGSSNLRLAGGGYYYGRVEVYHNGTWGTVCDDG
ncbi:PREDICTED: deleted in malignant brain tumors 1 protein-like [Acropora digitifera]|uniref:deleted in malignant brain tumors 1 protein-like n=1 Tax=Acropora digitifera TaxID=70779 RepID=UPI00077AD4FF|nr:PREDICTED: deleted in malignant brain tumors 1 protein-like [Acropora digitifera]